MNGQKYLLTLPSHTDNLEIIRGFLNKISEKNGIESDIANNIELAVDEAVTNVIKHAYEYSINEAITIKVKVSASKIDIIIIDNGTKFKPNLDEIVDVNKKVEGRNTGGYGLFLMKKLMDKVNYNVSPDNKNQVILTKNLK